MPARSTNTPSTMYRVEMTLIEPPPSPPQPSSEQVIGREQPDPDDVHEVPVDDARRDRGVLLGREDAAVRLERQQIHEQGAAEHVREVEAGHREEQRREDPVAQAEAEVRVVVDLQR